MFTLWNLFKAFLLMINSLAILHEKRFLKKYGWDRVDMSYGGSTIKNQCVGLLQMIQWFRVPLIFVNFLFIILDILIG